MWGGSVYKRGVAYIGVCERGRGVYRVCVRGGGGYIRGGGVYRGV